VDDPALVRFVERAGDLGAERQSFALGERAGADLRRQRRPGDVLHHQVVDAVLAVEIVDRADVRVVQPCQGQRLFAKAHAGRFAVEGAAGEDLQRHVPLEPLVTGPVHDTHPARTNLLDQAVVSEGATNHRFFGAHG